uniref:T-box domain-containing protein n=1 Tax=Panagrolaimus sp. PS1159 TaxID=55785 RepID=A0AC35GRQ3_9BILA
MSSVNRFSIEYLLSEDVKPPTKRLRENVDNEEEAVPSKVSKLSLRNISVSLEGSSLWKRFHTLGTEMIVTKSGRRMFPTLQITVKGLLPTASYSFMVDFSCIDNKRYRYSFHQSKWMVAGPGDAELPSRLHVHGDSPALGDHWMKQVIAFDKIKLTNNQLDQNGH